LQWFVKILEDGTVAIQNPADIFPSSSLSYEGEAEEGKKIIPAHIADFPTRQWHVEVAPQRPLPVPYLSACNPDLSLRLLLTFSFMNCSIRVPDKDLIVVSPLDVFPPQACRLSYSVLNA